MRPGSRITLSLLALGVLSISVEAGVSPVQIKRASSLTIKGDRALKRGDFDSASIMFRKALDRLAYYPDAHLGLGQLAMTEGRFEDALEHFTRAHDGFVELGAALLNVRAKRYASAQSEIGKLRDRLDRLSSFSDSETPGPWYSNVDQQLASARAKIRELEGIQSPNPHDAAEPPGEIYFHIGNALFRLGRTDEALTAWETCRRKTPDYPIVYNNLALAYWQAGRIDEAAEHLARAEALGFPVHPQFKADLQRHSR